MKREISGRPTQPRRTIRQRRIGAICLTAMAGAMTWWWPQQLSAEVPKAADIPMIGADTVAQKLPTEETAMSLPSDKKPKSYDTYTVVGAVEPVMIYPARILVRARIDTGAKSSSIDGQVLENFIRDGADWVRIRIFGNNDATHDIELPVERWVKIRRAGAPSERRAVVEMHVCIGTVLSTIHVNLSNRRRLNYRMLIGRDVLGGKFLVEAGSSDLTRPDCNEEKRK